ncbi:AMP-binding protein [Sulfurovum sp. zt1-1]|uniref:AMP-binding protein n=1 Tax=Sulfurovum zhangzhouensis TaxID=3019067 RepID=A0ABT7QV54_9BACT|nr:AMP-binding protein [Sulfurovum zhangzhouensis]MDM5270601.1 AMP-binding protein [Sulfurovum zhangzhouensis]
MLQDINTFSSLYDYLKKLPENETFLNHLEEGKWKTFSKSEFLETVRYLTLAFDARGWRDKKIAIAVSPSSYWLMVDYALMLCGAISVPLFTTISTKNLHYEIENAEVHTVFMQTDEQKNAIHLADVSITCIHFTPADRSCQSFEMLVTEGKTIDAVDRSKFDRLMSKVTPQTPLTIVYTSGTSGLPKGALLTHANLISQLLDTELKYPLYLESDKALSVLPLAHIFERMVMHFYLSQGISVYFVDNVKNIVTIMQDVQPTLMTVVPRLLEKVYFRMHQKALENSFFKRIIATAAFRHAKVKIPDGTSRLLDRIFDLLVHKKLRASFGGNFRMMISGGAPLTEELNCFFTNIGIPLYQGYGLTEASPVICANAPGFNKIGTCGKHYAHTEVKLTQENELLARGPGIMKGYINNIEASKEALDDEGWLHTGDLASIDQDGYITITGRKKDLAKTSTGEYISVNYIEQLLTAIGWFDYVMIIGNNRPFVVALLMIDQNMISDYAQKNGFKSIEEAASSKKFTNQIDDYIEKVNTNLNHWEKIRSYYLVTEQLKIENGDITPSMKIAREHLQQHFHKEIEQMYGGHI